MTAAAPSLEPGRVYRTRELATWSANAPRLARRLVDEGALVPLAHGLFAHLRPSRFGPVPPRDEEPATERIPSRRTANAINLPSPC